MREKKEADRLKAAKYSKLVSAAFQLVRGFLVPLFQDECISSIFLTRFNIRKSQATRVKQL